MSFPGIDESDSGGNNNSGNRSDKRRKILLGSVIGLGLLSLLLFLANPGLFTPPNEGDNNSKEAEATPIDDNNQNLPDDNSGTNSTDSGITVIDMPTVTNNTIPDSDGDSNPAPVSHTGGSGGYVIDVSGNSTVTVPSGGGSHHGGGGGGGGGDSPSDSDNHAPRARDGQVTTNEDSPVVFKMNGTDSDGDSLTYTIISGPLHGTITSFDNSTGDVTYSPEANYFGTDSITFKVKDRKVSSEVATITITVNSALEAPVAANFSAQTDEDTPILIDLASHVTDADGDSITISNTTQASHGTIVDNNNGTVTYTPDANYNGNDSFTYRATDGTFESTNGNVSIAVSPVNDPLVIDEVMSVTTPEDTPIDITVVTGDVDVDGDLASLEVSPLPIHGSVSISADNHTITYTPDANYNGQDSFQYTISDGVFNATGSVIVTVTPVNDAPIIFGDGLQSISVDEDSSVTIDILVNVVDPDGDTIAIEVGNASHGTIVDNGNGTVTYTPDANYNGQDSFQFTVSDGNGGTAIGSVAITVNSLPDAPIANPSQSEEVNEDESVTFALDASDPDGDAMTFNMIPPGTSHGDLVDNGDGTVTYTPDANYNGTDSFEYQATDGTADSDVVTVSITVNPMNDDPVAMDDNLQTQEDIAGIKDVLANDADIDGDSLSIESVTDPSNGDVVDNGDGTVTYTPDANYNGTDSFEYTISDGHGGTDTATVSITIGGTNDAPIANPSQSEEVNEDESVTFALDASDPDGDAMTFNMIPPGTSHGDLVDNGDGTVTYTPVANYNGNDSFEYQATDGTADSDVVTVSITVNPMNDDPVAMDDNAFTTEETTLNYSVLQNDADPDGDTLSVTSITDPANGVAAINGDNTVSYTPNTDFNGMDSFQYTIDDAHGGISTATVTITVNGQNDAPVANDDSAFTTLEAPVRIDVLANDTDIDSSVLSIGSFSQASHGTVALASDGKALIYTPNAGFGDEYDTFTYTASDGTNSSNTATVTIFVYPASFGHLQPPVGGSGSHEFEQGNTASIRFKLFDETGAQITNANVTLKVQQLDNDNNPIGSVMDATSAGGANDGNYFRYSSGFYHYDLKTDDMALGNWALYVYLIDPVHGEILMEDAPIDGISSVITIK